MDQERAAGSWPAGCGNGWPVRACVGARFPTRASSPGTNGDASPWCVCMSRLHKCQLAASARQVVRPFARAQTGLLATTGEVCVCVCGHLHMHTAPAHATCTNRVASATPVHVDVYACVCMHARIWELLSSPAAREPGKVVDLWRTDVTEISF